MNFCNVFSAVFINMPSGDLISSLLKESADGGAVMKVLVNPFM